MLGQILNELAEAEKWISRCIDEHSSHDPEHCAWAEMAIAMTDLGGGDENEAVAIVMMAMLNLLHHTKDTARAGNMIVDKVRQMTAAVARDRIDAMRKKNRQRLVNALANPLSTYNSPN
jgi:hypothetical protein